MEIGREKGKGTDKISRKEEKVKARWRKNGSTEK